MVLFIIFHFEQMLDKFEQIDYKDFKSIRLMLPLYNSKMRIVEDLLKTWYPKYSEYITQYSPQNFKENLFKQWKIEDFVTVENTAEELIKGTEKSEIESWLLKCQNESIKAGITDILNFSGLCQPLITLYYKCLCQLKRMYEVCKTPELKNINKSTGKFITKCRMQRSKEVITLRMLQLIPFLSETEKIGVLINTNFECLNMDWPELYLKAWELKLKYGVGEGRSFLETLLGLWIIISKEEIDDEILQGVWDECLLKLAETKGEVIEEMKEEKEEENKEAVDNKVEINDKEKETNKI